MESVLAARIMSLLMHRLFFSLSSALWAATTPVAPPPDQCLGAQANWTFRDVLYEPRSPRCAPWRAQARDLQNPASSSEFCSLPDGPQSTRIYADIITEGVSGVGVGPVADPDAFPSLFAGLKKMLCLRRQGLEGLTALWHRQVGRRGDPLQPSGSGASTEPPKPALWLILPRRKSAPCVSTPGWSSFDYILDDPVDYSVRARAEAQRRGLRFRNGWNWMAVLAEWWKTDPTNPAVASLAFLTSVAVGRI